MNSYLTYLIIFFSSIVGVAQTPEVELVVQSGHTGEMQAMAFSPDGKWLVTSAEDRKIIIWDTKLGLNLKTLSETMLTEATFSPDGQHIIGVIKDIHGGISLGIWDWKNQEPLVRTLQHPGLTTDLFLSFSPDGSLLAVCSPKVILVYRWQEGEVVLEMEPQEELRRFLFQFSGIDFSPDGQYLAYSKIGMEFRKEYSTIEVVHLETGAIHKQLTRPKTDHEYYAAEQLQFVDDHELAVIYRTASSSERKIWRWDWKADKQSAPSPGFKLYGQALFDPKTKRFLVSSDKQILTIPHPYEDISQAFPTEFSTYGIAWDASNNLVALSLYQGDPGRVDLFNGLTGDFLESWGEPLGAVTSVDFAKNGFLATSNIRQVPRLWHLTNSDGVHSFMAGSFEPKNFSYGNVYLTDNADKLVYTEHHQSFLWKTGQPNIAERLDRRFPDENRFLAISPDQRLIASIYGQIYDSGTMKVEKDLGIKNALHIRNGITFSPDGQYLVISSFGKLMRWRLPGFERLPDIPMPNTTAFQLKINADGVLASLEKTEVKLRHLETGEVIAEADVAGEDLVFSPDGKTLFVATESKINIYNTKDLSLIETITGHPLKVTCLAMSPEGRLMASGSNDGLVRLWDWKSRQLVATMAGLGRDGFIIYTPDHYYMTRRGTGKVSFKVGSDKLYPFEQFDLQFNRPDIVLERIGFADQALIRAFERAYSKRMEKFGLPVNQEFAFEQLPQVQLPELISKSTTDSVFTLDVNATDPAHRLDRLHILVNEVPVFGKRGKAISSGKTFKGKIQFPLLEGSNRVQVFVTNEKGISSLQEGFEVYLSTPLDRPDLYLIAVGVSQYADETMSLKYAAKDARDVVNLFQTRPGVFRKNHIFQFLDEEATRSNILNLKSELKKSRVQDKVVFFVAGHGVLDKNLDYFIATHDMDFSNPKEKGIRFEELEDLLDGIPALHKTLLIDACHAGEVDKAFLEIMEEKAPQNNQVIFRALPNYTVRNKELGLQNSFDLMKHLFTDLRRNSGTVVIAAAGAGEYALEGDAYQNGVFTYTLLQGLTDTQGPDGYAVADQNEDQEVSINELQDYLLTQVAKLTDNQQQPLTRVDYLYNDFTFLTYLNNERIKINFRKLSAENLEQMMEAGLNVNHLDKDGATVLMRVVYGLKEDNPEIIKKLIEHGADPLQKGVIYPGVNSGYLGNLLSVAAYTNKPKILKYLVQDQKVPVNDREWNPRTKKEDGWTALQWAVVSTSNQTEKEVSVVEVLLNHGADINEQRSGPDATPLLLALGKGEDMNPAITHLLIDRGADLSITNEKGENALHYAVRFNHFELIQKLVKKGLSPMQKALNGKTPVDLALENKHYLCLEALLTSDRMVEKELGDDDQYARLLSQTPKSSRKLLAAIFDQNHKAVRNELAAGAKVNVRDKNGAPFLMHIARHFDFPFVKEMIEAGADCQQKGVIWIDQDNDAYYGNLMGIAASKDDYKLLEYLIKTGKVPVDDREYDPASKLETGWTALQWAASSNALGAMEVLLDYNANLNIGAQTGDTPLLIFMRSYANSKVAGNLIAKGANVTIKDQNGATALHYACRDKLYDVGGQFLCHKIINKGVPIDAPDNFGWTPLMYAANAGHHLLCLNLINSGADCTLKNKQGQTALDIAKQKNRYQTIDVLKECN